MGSSIEISKTEPNGEIKIGQYKISYKFEEEIENSSKKFEKKVEVCLLKKNEIIYQKVFNSDQRTIFIMLPEKF